MIEELKWDSQFFGLKVGVSRFANDSEWSHPELSKWDLVYFFVDPRDQKANRILEEKALLADIKVTYSIKINHSAAAIHLPDTLSIYNSSPLDDVVIGIGKQSGSYSRFNVDPDIPHQKFEELYSIWMKKSISREIADEVFVFRNKNKIIGGVITIGIKNGRGEIGILAVDESFRGQHVGTLLIQQSKKYCYEKKIPELQVVTQQKNLQACRFYEKCGFKAEDIINVYHYWKKWA